ncbi:MAG: hypothetical protein AB7S54_10155 [Bacteroidales bacterium]
MQIYKNICVYIFLLTFVIQGCSKNLSPQTVPVVPGKSAWRVKREQKKRERQAYWHKRKTERLTNKTERKLEKSKRESLKALEKLRKEHINNQLPEVQVRMKETEKQAEQNNSKRTLRQRLRIWKFKKK